jgi:hypothetical protein
VLLASSITTFAAAGNRSATSSDTGDVTKVVVTKNNWIIVEVNAFNGIKRLRDFHDIGAPGLQQIDYAVNCADQKLALLEFAIVQNVNTESHFFKKNRKITELSFYRPVTHHDKNIVETVCHRHYSGR